MRRKKWLLISILAAVVLLALVGCQAETFTVAFDTDGGSAIASLTVEKGKEIERPAEPEKSGYRFDGWYKDQDRTELFDFSSEKINGNATLFAKWIRVFEVVFDTDGGSAVSSAIVDSGSVAIRPADPSKAGKNFGGWYKESQCINKYYFNEPVSSDMTLFAKWVDQITYTVNFYVGNYDGQHEWSLWHTQTVAQGDAADEPEIPEETWYIPEEHMTYSFMRWETDFDDIQSNADIYAVYQIDFDEFGFSGGYGTINEPWEIASSVDLEDMAEKIASDAVSESGVRYAEGYYIQTDNIFARQSIRLIGDGVDFEGVYDGQNHCVFFLTNVGHGLFGVNRGLIENFGFLLKIPSNDQATGALTTENYGTIKNCRVQEYINIVGSTIGSSVITQEQAESLYDFYGVVGSILVDNASWFTVVNHEGASIEDCSAAKGISSSGDGCVIAFTNFGTITNFNQDSSVINHFGNDAAGAVIDNYGVIENVSVDYVWGGDEFVAGIAMYNHEGAVIKNCRSYTVDFNRAPDGCGAAGGAVVINRGTIINSTASVGVGVCYAKQSAGVAVENYGIIDGCYGNAEAREIAAGIVLYARDGSLTANCSFNSIWGGSAAGIAYLVEEGAVVKNCSNAQANPYINYFSEDEFGNALGVGTVGGIVSKNYGIVEDCKLYTWTMYSSHTPARYSPFFTVAYHFVGNGIIGGIVGENYGTVRRCDTGATVFGEEAAGGIVGVNENGLIEYCTFVASAAVVANSGVAGGAVGIMNGGTIRRTYCNIFEGFSILRLSSCFVRGSEAAGGFIGRAANATVSECYTVDRFQYGISSLARIGAFVGQLGSGCVFENCFYIGEMTNVPNAVSVMDGGSLNGVGIKNLTLEKARDLSNCGFNDVVWSVNEKNNDGLPLLAGKASVFTWLDELTKEEISEFLEEGYKNCGDPVLESFGAWEEYQQRTFKSEINTYFTRKDDDTSSFSCFDSLSQYLIYEFQKSFTGSYWQMAEALLRYREPETTDFNVYAEGWVNETDIEDLKYYLLSGAYNFEGKAYINLYFSDELAEFLAEQLDAFVQGEQTLSEWLESKTAERFGESSEEYKALRIWLRARKPSFWVAPSEGSWADLSLQEFMEFLVEGDWKYHPLLKEAVQAGLGDFVEEIIARYDVFAQNFDGNILFGEFSENWVNDNFAEGSAEREWWSVLKNLKYQNISLSDFLKANILKQYGEESEQYWALINEILNPEFRDYVDCDADPAAFVVWIEDDGGWYDWSLSDLKEAEFVEIRSLLVQWTNEYVEFNKNNGALDISQYSKLSDWLKANMLKQYGEESEQYWALINEILNPEFRDYVDCDADPAAFVAWIEDDGGWYDWSLCRLREAEFVEIRSLLVQWTNEYVEFNKNNGALDITQYSKLSDWLKANMLKQYGEESEQYWALINEILNPEFRDYVDCDADPAAFVVWIEDDEGWYNWSDCRLREAEFVEIRSLLVQWTNEFSAKAA